MKKLPRRNTNFLTLICIAFLMPSICLEAREYFVMKSGNDANDGYTREAPFATIQKGVDVLTAGDILTIGAGEYFGSVTRDDLGNLEKETIIRADISGTVLLRGDVAISSPFRKVDGYHFVYEADWDQTLQSVNELDTLSILIKVPNITEVEALPGSFHYDPEARKLYLSTEDQKPPQAHQYTASIINGDGLYLGNPKRVTVEGLVMCGFNSTQGNPWAPAYRSTSIGMEVAWGILIGRGQNCSIRNCTVYLNGGGIGVDNGEGESKGGDNAVDDCVAYGNFSQLNRYDSGAIAVFRPNGDTIRNCYAYKNRAFGIKTYIRFNRPAKITGSTTWGNFVAGNKGDILVKDINPDEKNEHTHVENSVAMGFIKVVDLKTSIVPTATSDDSLSSDNIFLHDPQTDAPINPDVEFADAQNYDFHLQETSIFRGTGPNKTDRGPHPYKANIFYVSNAGNDAANGLSVAHAWKSLGRATKNLKPGDTLYLQPGVYAENMTLQAQGKDAGDIILSGRGSKSVVIKGTVQVKSGQFKMERLTFIGGVTLANIPALDARNCQFEGKNIALDASKVGYLKIAHCNFFGFKQAAIKLQDCQKVYLSGNLYDNITGVAVQMDEGTVMQYSDYNSYSSSSNAWRVGEKVFGFLDFKKEHDHNSREIKPRWKLEDKLFALENAAEFVMGGPLGKPFGVYRDKLPIRKLKMLTEPAIHSVSATTANIEWMTSLPSMCEIAWGETQECENSESFAVNRVGSYSLTGLQPGTTYYFKVKSISSPADVADKDSTVIEEIKENIISFTTAKKNAAPQIYYVAPDGDNANSGLDRQKAWKSIAFAAGKVNVGDTVVIAGGNYSECIRIRSTGEEGNPITFKSVPGERVAINGSNKSLINAFVAGKKSNLNFDGLYFNEFGGLPDQGWYPMFAGTFLLTQCKDIHITRCFDDGRGKYTSPFITAWHTEGLTIKNCVQTNKFCGMLIYECPNLVVENNVFACPMIYIFLLRNTADQTVVMKNNIFTDMFEVKAAANDPLFELDSGSIEGFHQENNCYFLRCFPTEQRNLVNVSKLGLLPIGKLGDFITNPVFADPDFATAVTLNAKLEKPNDFPPALLMNPDIPLTFSDFFSTNPTLTKRGIGLIPEDFVGF